MHRAGVEGILGIRREGAFLVVDPCIPAAWPGFEASVELNRTRYDIRVVSVPAGSADAGLAMLDDVTVERADDRVRVPLDGGTHRLTLQIASATRARRGSGTGSEA